MRYLIITIIFFAFGCSGKLSESKIEEMISKEFNLPFIDTQKVNISYYSKISEEVKKLETDGFLIFKKDGYDTKIEFKDKSKQYLFYQEEFNKTYHWKYQYYNGYSVAFDKITGIKYNKNVDLAKVVFTIKYINVTPLSVFSNDDEIKEGNTIKRELLFSKYEDGWRIEKNPKFSDLQQF